MKKQTILSLIALSFGLIFFSACQPIQPVEARSVEDAPAVMMTQAHVETHPSQGDVVTIEGASAHLYTTDEGATMVLHTNGLEPGNVYTAWWVVIHNPEACAGSPCAGSDVIGNTDGVEGTVGYADGIIVGEDGIGRFASHLPVGALVNSWYDRELSNPQNAEIHVVINDHGPLIPEMAATMLNSYRGGCTTESLPAPFPDTAKADGEPGPNTCRLLQDAIFVQR